MKAVNTNRRSEINIMAGLSRQEKINELKRQLDIEENTEKSDMGVLEHETIELRGLFDVLQDFNTLDRNNLLSRLHQLLMSYVSNHPEQAENAVSTFADLNHLIAGLYYHKELIEKKFNEYTELADEVDLLSMPNMMSAS